MKNYIAVNMDTARDFCYTLTAKNIVSTLKRAAEADVSAYVVINGEYYGVDMKTFKENA